MKRNIRRTTLLMVFFATLFFSMARAMRADDRCSTAKAAGDWGHTYTGTLILRAGAVPLAALARWTQDAEGNFSGTQTRTLNGSVAEETFTGAVTVSPLHGHGDG